MSLCKYAKLKVSVSRAALKTDFQNVNNSAKGTSISSSIKTGLLFFFPPPKRKQIKTPGKSIFPSSLLFTSIRGPRAQMFLRYRKIDSTMSTRPQTENPRPRISWSSPKSTPTKQKPSGLIWKRLPAAQSKPCNTGTQGYACKWAWTHRR